MALVLQKELARDLGMVLDVEPRSIRERLRRKKHGGVYTVLRSHAGRCAGCAEGFAALRAPVPCCLVKGHTFLSSNSSTSSELLSLGCPQISSSQSSL